MISSIVVQFPANSRDREFGSNRNILTLPGFHRKRMFLSQPDGEQDQQQQPGQVKRQSHRQAAF